VDGIDKGLLSCLNLICVQANDFCGNFTILELKTFIVYFLGGQVQGRIQKFLSRVSLLPMK
jgi:hypothetical protein